MDEKLAKIIAGLADFKAVAQFEENARKLNRFDEEVAAAVKARAIELGNGLVAERTGLDLTSLSPAEEKIVRAAAEYAAIMKRRGSNSQRMFNQLSNRGLLGSAEVSVQKSKPTQGFNTLADEDRVELSYEQIIVDHSSEFSERALWYARRALKLPNDTAAPPPKAASSQSPTGIQPRTEDLLEWLQNLSSENGGLFPTYTNSDAAAAIGMESNRPYGQIVSRIDFACYRAGLPPLGLTAETPFAKAWSRRDKSWSYPIPQMQVAAKAHVWTEEDYERILQITEDLSGAAHVIWQAEPENKVRAWAFGLIHSPAATDEDVDDAAGKPGKNKPWNRAELILALDLYLQSRASPFSKESAEVIGLSALLNSLSHGGDGSVDSTYRNPNGVYMKMMNFRRFDPDYTSDGKVGLTRGNKLEEVVWKEYADDAPLLALAVAAIKAGHGAPEVAEQPYWVFVCNPKKWAVDRFFDRNIEEDTWGVRPADKEKFAPGQLGIVRVGVDRRNAGERNGRPPLEPGIYALCEVISTWFPGSGANDEFWNEGEGREPGWPTVKIRYLHVYRDKPLTIGMLKALRPQVSPLLLGGFQAASFPISGADFREVAGLLGYDLDDMPLLEENDTTADKLAALEKQFIKASPEVKERVSRTIERGQVGRAVKKALGFKCQLCYALGKEPLGFAKKDGEPYAEAHHVMPVAALQVGSLAASNIMILCANHHRQVHYGDVSVLISEATFDLHLDGLEIKIPRSGIDNG